MSATAGPTQPIGAAARARPRRGEVVFCMSTLRDAAARRAGRVQSPARPAHWPAVAVCWIWFSTVAGLPFRAVPMVFWIAVSTVLQFALSLGYSVAVDRFCRKPVNSGLVDMVLAAEVVAGSRSYSLS